MIFCVAVCLVLLSSEETDLLCVLDVCFTVDWDPVACRFRRTSVLSPPTYPTVSELRVESILKGSTDKSSESGTLVSLSAIILILWMPVKII